MIMKRECERARGGDAFVRSTCKQTLNLDEEKSHNSKTMSASSSSASPAPPAAKPAPRRRSSSSQKKAKDDEDDEDDEGKGGYEKSAADRAGANEVLRIEEVTFENDFDKIICVGGSKAPHFRPNNVSGFDRSYKTKPYKLAEL